MEALDWHGAATREWMLDAPVRYVRCVGGPTGREGLLAGLLSGAVLMLYVDRDAPVPLFTHDAPVRCVRFQHHRESLIKHALPLVGQLPCKPILLQAWPQQDGPILARQARARHFHRKHHPAKPCPVQHMWPTDV